jgi:hypothetical protein
MTEEQFIEKYGKTVVYFSYIYKFRMHYHNTDLGIECSGVVESRDDMRDIETVQEVFDLDHFQFNIKQHEQ